MGKSGSFVLAVVLVGSLLGVASSAKVLLMMPLATKSETHLVNPLAKGLLDNGHEVTLVTPASSSIKHRNLTEVIPIEPLDLSDFDPSQSSVLDMRKGKDDLSQLLFMDFSYIYDYCHRIYQNEDFQKVLQAESYDIALTSVFFSDCFLGIFSKFNTPFVYLSSMPPPKEILDLTGLRTPLSIVPNPFLPYTDDMSLSQRLINTLSSWSYSLVTQHHFYKIGERIYRQYLDDESLPSVVEIRKNLSLILTNTHISLNFPRPTLPEIIEVGGIHTHAAKPLPKDLEEFCSGGKHGFILFSLGTCVTEDSLPESLKQTFINVFAKLKTRVLWKWKSEIKGLPENVKISKWLPQQDVLGHPNIRLFFSHGGLLGTQEAIYHAVPILGLPVFADQDVNMKQAEAHGYAMKLELLDVTEDYLFNALNRMLNDTSFAENAKKASEIFRDQPQTPLERALFYMEYVIKYKGAPQLRSAARNLSYVEYHLYDVHLILLAILGTVLLTAWKIVSTLLRLSNRRRSSRKMKMNGSKKYQ